MISVGSGDTGLSRIVTIDLRTGVSSSRLNNVSQFAAALTSRDELYALDYKVINGNISTGRKLIRKSLLKTSKTDTLSGELEWLSFGGFSSRGIVVGTKDAIGLVIPETREFRKLLGSNGSQPNVSPDGNFAAFELPGRILAVLNLSTNNVTPLSGLPGWGPKWSKDGSYLYFMSTEGLPASTTYEASVVRMPVRLGSQFERLGPPEFVMHVRHPKSMAVGNDRVIVISNGDVSDSVPKRESAHVVWWRHIGQQLEETLPR